MNSSRRGYSLIEMIVVIALMAGTFTTVAITMHTLYRAEHRLQDDIRRLRVIEQIAAKLRADAHQATSAEMMKGAEDSENRVLTLSLSDARKIEYALSARGLDRTVKQGQEVEHRDRFHFPSASNYFWIVDATRDRPLVALHLIDQRTSDKKAEHNVTVIQAAVGVLGRFAKND